MVKSFIVSIICLITMVGTSQENSFRVMTFNIRLPNTGDGINYWDNRRPLVANTILTHSPAIIGVQEAYRRQLDEMVTDMPAYDWYGVCRTDGKIQPNPDSEFSAILYQRDRFERLDGNTFWLSLTPEVVGSKGWDAALPRIVTWAKFKDKKSGKIFFCFNTHFDHVGDEARGESARLLRTRMKAIAGDMPVVLMGDFNSDNESTAYLLLTNDQSPYRMKDAKLVSKTPPTGALGTFSRTFMLADVGDDRIDFIFVRNNITVLKHAILSDSVDGRLPSDHLPVLAELRIE